MSEPLTPTKFETITRETAEQLFAKRRQNRPLRQSGVRQYAEQMKAKQWREYDRSQSPILIDNKGKLAGGQHRIAAFLASELPEMIFPVAYDATEAEIKNQDAAIARSFGDQVVMFHGLPSLKNVTASKLNAVGRLLCWQGGEQVTPKNASAAIHRSKKALSEIADNLIPNGRVSSFAPLLAAFVVAKSRMTEETWKTALTDVDTGTVEKTSPLALLSRQDTRRQGELFRAALYALWCVENDKNVRKLEVAKDWSWE